MRLKELSAKLGLSQTTVSRALNGYRDVSEDTRNRVLEAARHHNYRPDARARGLAIGRARAIGHVIPSSTRHEIVNPVFADFIAGAGETYAREGYDMVLSVVGDASETRLYRELAATRRVDGIIVHGPRADDPRVALLRELGLPFVVHGRVSEEDGPYSWLDVNNRRAFFRATEFLRDLGHRRIALVNGLEYMDFAIRRRAGYLAALAEGGIAADAALMSSGEMTEPYGHRAARRMLALDSPPTGFLVASLISALGVRRAVEERGLVLGRDVSVVTHDDALGYFSDPDAVPVFTATRSSVREAGRLAAEMLLEIVEASDGAPRHRLLEAVLTVGLSTGPAPAAG